jgi:hypothetical protein
LRIGRSRANRCGSSAGTTQAGGPQENGSRHAAETVGARNENSGNATGMESGTKATIGAAASAGMEANWQIEQ